MQPKIYNIYFELFLAFILMFCFELYTFVFFFLKCVYIVFIEFELRVLVTFSYL